MPFRLTIHLRNSEPNGSTKLTGVGSASSLNPAVRIKTNENKTLLVPWSNILMVEQGREIENISKIDDQTRKMFPVDVQCDENPSSRTLSMAASQ